MNNLYLPAEWERQRALQLTWPHKDTDWNYCLDEINNTYVEMADAITRYEPLIIVAPDTKEVERMLCGRLSEEQMKRVTLHQCPTNDTWARDHAFISLKERNAEDGPLTLLDFRFNGWGEKFGWQHDNAITRHLCEQGLLHGSREDHDDMVLEGGSIESDGRGTVFTTSQCLLAPHRNQPLSREEIDAELRRRLRARRVVWINHGNLVGDDTDGHIDTTVRVAPHDTLLYIKCSDQADEHYADFCAMERELQALRTDDGRPYRLIALPMVDEIRYDDERLPATYANFLIVNGAVIYPTYDQPHNDQAAAEALQQAFPDHELIGIDSRVIIRQHGSIHCLTMQLPEGVLCR